jgi:hypothetical protein
MRYDILSLTIKFAWHGFGSPTSGSRSIGIVRSRTQAMEFFWISNTKKHTAKRKILTPFFVENKQLL